MSGQADFLQLGSCLSRLLVQLYYPSQVEPCTIATSVVAEDRLTSVYSAPSCKGTFHSLFVACYDALCGGLLT